MGQGRGPAFCGLSLVSCLSLRFSPRHEKDNYRAAAALATDGAERRPGGLVECRGGRSAVLRCAADHQPRQRGRGAAGPESDAARPSASLPLPQVIIASKPDLYDGQSALAEYLREQGFQPAGRFTAFVIWAKERKLARWRLKSLSFTCVDCLR